MTDTQDDTGNVVKLPGTLTMLEGEVSADVVTLLSDWLEAAKRGEIVQVMLAAVKPNSVGNSSEWAGSASMDACLAATAGLYTRVQAAWLRALEE